MLLLKDKNASMLIAIFLLFSCQSNDGSKTKSDSNQSTLIGKKLIDRSSETPTDSALYKNSELPIMDRVRDLMTYMTIEDKEKLLERCREAIMFNKSYFVNEMARIPFLIYFNEQAKLLRPDLFQKYKIVNLYAYMI